MKDIGIILIGLLFLINTNLKATDEGIIVDDYHNYYNPALKSSYLIDEEQKLNFDEIRTKASQNNFIPNKNEIIHFGLGSSNIWIKFSIQNLLSTSPYLEIDNPALDTVEYFLVNKSGVLVHHYETGNNIKIEERNLKSCELMIDLNLHDSEQYTCYLKINAQSSTILAPMRIASLIKFYEIKHNESIWQGLYFGLILFLFIYNVFLFFSLKDSIYIYFSFFIAFMGLLFALFKGFGIQYLWGAFPEFNQFTPLLGSLAGIFMIMFSAKFLDSKNKIPKLHFWLLVLIGFYACIISLNILGFHYISTSLIIYNSMVGLTFLMFLAVKAWRDGYEPAKFYLLAWSFYVVGIVTSFLRDNSLIEVNLIVGNILQITSTISILFMSFALSKKINIYIKKRNEAQELAFKTAIENEKLISNQNLLLEEKVIQRTIDLEQTISTLSKQRRDLHEANVFKDKVFSIISHDLKSPISTLAGMLNIMKLKSLSELERVNILDKLEIALKNTKNLLDNILAWANKNDERQNERLEFELKSCVDNILQLFQHLANEKGIDISGQIQSQLNLLANKNMVQLVLRNLISNAIKFTPKNGSIVIRAEEDNQNILIHVVDTGVGINEDIQRNILNGEIYNSTRGTENEKGTGLGLLLCKEFIDKFNGELFVSSTPGKGSKFTVALKDAIPLITVEAL